MVPASQCLFSFLLEMGEGSCRQLERKEEEKWWHHITKGTHIIYFTFLISSLGVVYWIEVKAEG